MPTTGVAQEQPEDVVVEGDSTESSDDEAESQGEELVPIELTSLEELLLRDRNLYRST